MDNYFKVLNPLLSDVILYVPVNFFQPCRDRSAWVEPVLADAKVSWSRTQHSDTGEAQNNNIVPSFENSVDTEQMVSDEASSDQDLHGFSSK